MKLLIVTPYYYPKIGGLENYVHNLVNELGKQESIEIVIITSNHESNKYEEYLHKGVRIYRLPILFRFSNTPVNLRWFADIRNIIEKEKPDVINAHSPVPFIADVAFMSSKKIPFVFTYHAGSMKKNKPVIDQIIGLYESTFLKYIITNAESIICTSQEFIKNDLKPYAHKVHYIPPGVDTEIYKPSLNKKRKKIIYVGRIEKSSEWKGLYTLIDAMCLVNKDTCKVELELIGPGDAIDQYAQYVNNKNMSESISFLGPLRGQELVKKLQEPIALVLPSTTNAESFGMVLIEAMACGTAVIGSNVGGIPYVIDQNKNGFLVEPKDAVGLAKAIIQLVENENLARSMGVNGRKKVEKYYSWETVVQNYKKILYEVKNQ